MARPLSRRVRNLGFRLGLRRRLERDDLVAAAVALVGAGVIVGVWFVRAHHRLLFSAAESP